jgi:hypothetical protein
MRLGAQVNERLPQTSPRNVIQYLSQQVNLGHLLHLLHRVARN